MNAIENAILRHFKQLIQRQLLVHKVIVFGSRARGDADIDSDMDVLVILDQPAEKPAQDCVSDCAWEAAFEHGVVLAPLTVSRTEWEEGPERCSSLGQAVEREGILV